MGFCNPWSLTAKLCDSCKSAAAAVFCRADSAALCLSCDVKIHNKLTRPHGRVWMCEVCEQAPAAVTCKADAAVLCVTCDADIHSANPLASRHERFPVEPFFEAAESMVARSTAFNFLALPDDSSGGGACPRSDAEAEADAWLIHGGGAAAADVQKAGDFSAFFNGNDPFLDFEYGIAVDNRQFHFAGTDGLVPVKDPVLQSPVMAELSPENAPFKFEFCGSDNNKKLSGSFSFQLGQHSVSHSISSSSLEVGVVPDGNCNSLSDNSYPLVQSSCTGPDPNSTTTSQPGPATPLYGMDREARVLRYREKRKNRKFEKTIRYASRKAYAETRPRIKGRFAKRTEADMEDSICTSTQFYGVVPTF